MDIQFSDLVVEYGKTRVLHKVHGNAICGQTLAIIGHSGMYIVFIISQW